jgi:hypothetical protein
MTATPQPILLFAWGKTETANGPVVISARTATELPAFQRAHGREEIPVDFEHGTVGADPEDEPRKVFGYCTLSVISPLSPISQMAPGLYMTFTRVTSDGRAHAEHYADISPAVILDPATREVIGCDSIAVTRTGAVPGLHLPPITFSAVKPVCRFASSLSPNKNTMPNPAANPANPPAAALPASALTALRKLLGLPETADDAATLDALDQAAAAMDAPVTPCSAPAADAATAARVSKLEAQILRLSAVLALPATPSETPGVSVTNSAASDEAAAAKAKRERAVVIAKRDGISYPDALKLA